MRKCAIVNRMHAISLGTRCRHHTASSGIAFPMLPCCGYSHDERDNKRCVTFAALAEILQSTPGWIRTKHRTLVDSHSRRVFRYNSAFRKSLQEPRPDNNHFGREHKTFVVFAQQSSRFQSTRLQSVLGLRLMCGRRPILMRPPQ